MVTSAIQKYQTLFSDPITVSIRFRLSGFRPDGTPLDTLVGASDTGIHQVDWNAYIAALKADGRTVNDITANASLPTTVLSPIILCHSANGRAVGLNTPPVMFADGSLGLGGPYDGIITINSLKPVQFTRPVSAGNFDGQMFTEHEIDEVLGMGSHLDSPRPEFLGPQDLFTWASLNARNTSASGQRFFSIDRGFHNIAKLNQNPNGDFGDWDSDDFCPAVRLYVNNAFNCAGQSTDIAATSPEGINLDVIGYDLVGALPRDAGRDINGDGNPDYVLYNRATRQTAIWYLNNNVRIGFAYGPTIVAGWTLAGLADFDRDGHPDYALFNPSTGRTAIWYLSGGTFLRAAYGPTLPAGWRLVAAGDFNADGKPDYVLYKTNTGQTALWYLNNSALVGGNYAAILSAGWTLAGVADFNGDGKLDYLLFNSGTLQSAICYLSGASFISVEFGPNIASGYRPVAAADANRDSKADYLLFNPGTLRTAMWYMNNNTLVSGAYGPTASGLELLMTRFRLRFASTLIYRSRYHSRERSCAIRRSSGVPRHSRTRSHPAAAPADRSCSQSRPKPPALPSDFPATRSRSARDLRR